MLLKLYSLPSTILVAYAIVIGYSVTWFTNTAFYLGARWGWITRLYWLYDLVLGLVIFAPLFMVSFFRVRTPTELTAPTRLPCCRMQRVPSYRTADCAVLCCAVLCCAVLCCACLRVPTPQCFEAIHMRCIFNNQVLNVIERTRMQVKSEWGAAAPEIDAPAVQPSPSPGNGHGNSSRRSSPSGSVRSSGLNTPLISPASTPGRDPSARPAPSDAGATLR